MTRIPMSIAALALVAGAVAACGDDKGDEPAAADPGSSSATTSPSASDSASTSTSPSPSDTANGDPVASPVVNKAVKAAIRDGFPALVPSGIPAGWTVGSASYRPAGGGVWQIQLVDPDGAPVTLTQSTADLDTLVAQLLPDGRAAGNVDLSDYGTGKWKAYTGASVAGLAKALHGTSAVLVGADQDNLVTLAQELLTAEDAGNSDGG